MKWKLSVSISDSLIILQVAGLSELMLQQTNNNGSTSIDKINENIAHAVLGLINTMDNGFVYELFEI